MEENPKDITIRRSNEVQAFVRSEAIEGLLNYRLSFFLRYGMLCLFLVTLMILALAWFIRIPETVNGILTLNTTNPPKTVVAKSSGKIISLKASDKMHVNKGQPLVWMECLANYEQVSMLRDSLSMMDSIISSGSFGQLSKIKLDTFIYLGELQKSFDNFMQARKELTYAMSDPVYAAKRYVIESRLASLTLMYYNLLEQQYIYQRDYDIATENFEIEKRLFKQNVNSKNELKEKEGIMLSKRLQLEQLNSSLISNQNDRTSVNEQLIGLNQSIETQKNAFILAYNSLRSDLQQWTNTYILTSPIEGTISFAEMFTENQNVKADDVLFFIIPEGSDMLGEVMVDQMNFGKIKSGQDVNIKFQGYPYQEFGMVKGKVKAIAEIPKNGKYLVRVDLTNGLVTNYKKNISFHNGLTGTAEIISDNRSLLDRLFFDRLRSLFIQ